MSGYDAMISRFHAHIGTILTGIIPGHIDRSRRGRLFLLAPGRPLFIVAEVPDLSFDTV